MSGVLHGIIAALKGAVTDTFWKYVTLLLNTSATNGAQNNTFLDSSTNNFSITRNGDTTQGSFNPYMPSGYWSGYFDGTGDSLVPPQSSVFNLSTGDWTIEAWFYSQSLNSGGARYIVVTPSSGNIYGLIPSGASNAFAINQFGTGNVLASVVSPTLNSWQHIALVKSGSTTAIYLDGVSIASGTVNWVNANTTIFFGSNTGSFADNYTGYISNARVVVGTAVYTANFTPPTTPLTAITNTSLLYLQDNRFKDNSTNAFAITVNGDTRISKFAPFNPPASYSAASYGGSGYFDGAGDYLNSTMTGQSFGTGNFTVEGWVYTPATGIRGIYSIAAAANGLDGSPDSALGTDSGNTWRLYALTNGSFWTSTATYVTNTWYHFAVVKNGTALNLYINGTSVISQTDTANYTNTNIAIGGFFSTSYLYQGYISNFRIVKGTAVYTAAFTPPTTPLTAITNTSLLLNFTNAGIFDAATINNGQTVADAQVSTTQAKFGTTSMAFDGTGDVIVLPARPEFAFRTGPFTVECWIYYATADAGVFRDIYYTDGSGNPGLSVRADNKVQLQVFATTIASTSTIPLDQWVHIAGVREGTGTNQLKLYINGVLEATGTNSTNIGANQTYVGASSVGGSGAFKGYIDEVRLSAYARYTANFTPPTEAFPTL